MGGILAIKMTALGDVAAALGHLERIYEHHKQEEVWLLTSPEAQCLFEEHPGFKIKTVDRDRRFFGDGVGPAIKWVKEQAFDRIYDLQGNKVSYRICKNSHAPERIGTQPYPSYTASPETKWVRTTGQNASQRLNDALACGGVAPAEGPGPIYFNADDEKAVEAFKEQKGLHQKKYVLFHAGSSPEWPSKRWPEEHFIRLAKMFASKGLTCVFTGAGAEKDVNERITLYAGVNATGMLSVRQLYLLAQGAFFAVSNDSAPMHVFTAAKIPVFAFFGPTNFRWSHGFGQKDNVLTSSIPCSPCFKGKCPKDKGHACMRTLTPEKVFAQIRKTVF